MPRIPRPYLLIAGVVALAPGLVPAAAGASWQSPLEAPAVARPFAFDRSRPYRPGQRRVADLRGRPGEAVRAPCAGPVLFAGPLPHGRGVSIECGRLSATLTGLASVSARRGATVLAGQPVGRLGGSGSLRLGARVAADRHGYVDPTALLGAGRRPAPPLAPAPLRRSPPRPTARRAAPRSGPVPVAAILMAAAWLGLGVAGTALGLGIALRRPAPAGAPAAAARHAGR